MPLSLPARIGLDTWPSPGAPAYRSGRLKLNDVYDALRSNDPDTA